MSDPWTLLTNQVIAPNTALAEKLAEQREAQQRNVDTLDGLRSAVEDEDTIFTAFEGCVLGVFGGSLV